jgi:hypothetical protein
MLQIAIDADNRRFPIDQRRPLQEPHRLRHEVLPQAKPDIEQEGEVALIPAREGIADYRQRGHASDRNGRRLSGLREHRLLDELGLSDQHGQILLVP